MTPEHPPDEAVNEYLKACRQNPRLTPEDFLRSNPDVSPAAVRVLQSINVHSIPAGTFTQPRSAGSASPEPVSVQPPSDPEPVKLGPYDIRRKLGQGGMGAVYLGVDSRLDREVAIKVIRPEIAAHPQARARFLREAKAMAAVRNDHVATIFATDEEPDGTTWLAMELLEGESLDDALKNGRPFDWKAIIRIGRETALGLAAAHAKKLIHRDIKPANVWLEAPGGRVKILDFGLVRPAETDSDMTGAGALIGTPAYMAPEQADGGAVDHRCDLFSLGVLLYRLATGKSPFVGPTVLATLVNVTTLDPVPVSELRPDCPAGLADLIHRLMAKNSADRPPTAQAVVEELRQLERDDSATPLTIPPASVSRPEVTGGRRKRWLFIAPVMLLLLLPGGYVLINRTNKDVSERSNNAPGQMPVAGAPDDPAHAKVTAPASKESPKVVVVPEVGKGKPATVTLGKDSLPASFTNALGMEFVKVPKGTGWFGGGNGTPGETKAEIARDFYMGKYEVTQEEWTKVTGRNPSEFVRTADGSAKPNEIDNEQLKRFPAENMSWEDAQAFLRQLNKQHGQTGWLYRLPTSQEWEYACRGGPQSDKAISAFDFYHAKPANQLEAGKANIITGPGNGLQRPEKVGSYEPNQLGLYDMAGNVCEWCDNEYSPGGELRTTKGGGWMDIAAACRCSFIGACAPGDRRPTLGCRLVIVPVE